VASSAILPTVARATWLAGTGGRESHGQLEKRPKFQSHERKFQPKESAGLMVAEITIVPTANRSASRHSSYSFLLTVIRENQS